MGIHGDAQKLMRDFGLQCEGLVDLSEEANLRLCHPASGRLPEKWSLASELLSTLRASVLHMYWLSPPPVGVPLSE